jgi:hypothetical protein
MSQFNFPTNDDRLLTNFDIKYLAVYKESINDAVKLGLPNADKLVIDPVATDKDGRILGGYCALKVNCPRYLAKDLSEFWELFKTTKIKHGFIMDY